jgi:antitoxin VapB
MARLLKSMVDPERLPTVASPMLPRGMASVSLCGIYGVLDGPLHRLHQQSQPGGTPAENSRLPPDVHQVEIVKIGRSRLISPVGKRWDDLFRNWPRATDEFMSERHQPAAEEREPF